MPQADSVQSQQVSVRCILFSFVINVSLFAQKKPFTIDAAIQQSHEKEAPQVVWAPDGKHFAYFQGSEVMLYDVAAKSEKRLLSLEPLEKAAVPIPSRRDSTGRTAASAKTAWSGVTPAGSCC
jgi:hypothetical protein